VDTWTKDASEGLTAKPTRLTCEACGELARGDARGWRACFTSDNRCVFYCPVCAERELGEDEGRF